jgi:PKD repeat protein
MVKRNRKWEKNHKLVCLDESLYKQIKTKKGDKTYSQFIKSLMGILLILSLFVCAVGAADLAVDMKGGTVETTKTAVSIVDAKMNYTDKVSGISVQTSTKIDGADLKPIAMNTGKVDEVAYTSDDKQTATFKYNYFSNGTIKETIVLKEDMELSFPVTVPEGYVLIPWYNGEFKIVEASMQDTMTGLVAMRPFGKDAAGRNISMNYSLDSKTNILILNYDRYIPSLNHITNKIDKSPLQYPIIIDPTWTSTGGCWTTVVDGETVVMWNSTGSSTFTIPVGVSNISYLVVGGGGAGGGGSITNPGGGGGAGGMRCVTSFSVTAGSVVSVSVGPGGTGIADGRGSSAGSSIFSSITSSGGSYGGAGADFNSVTGGSGGGGAFNGTGGAGTAGQGRSGHNGGVFTGAPNLKMGGGGGGVSQNGGDPALVTIGDAGSGTQNNITGILTWYAGGGGGGSNSTGTCYGGAGTSTNGGGGSGTCADGYSGTNGISNKGGGGGGTGSSGYAGGTGGSGIVIIRFVQPIIANFTSNVTSGNIPLSVQFNDTSIGSPSSSWQWTFGDTGTSTTQNASHVYSTVGNYSVVLVATNVGGSNTSTKVYYINTSGGIPYAEFTANVTTGVNPLVVQFTDTTNASATAWNWTFGDGVAGGGNYSNSQNPVKTFSGVGRYNVSLNASSSSGFNRTNKSYYINVTAALVNPTAYLNITPSPNLMYVTLNGTSQLNARNITAKFIYANITFNKSEVNILSVVNNFSVYPGLTTSSIYNNASGFVSMNISNISGGNITIGNTLTPIADMRFQVNSYTNGSAPLNFVSAQTMLTTGDIETVNTTVPGVITTADSAFTFKVNIINAATNSKVNTLLTINTSATNITPVYIQISTGTATFSSNYTNVTFNVTCDGYYKLVQTVLIQNNNDVNLLLTPLTGPTQNTWYSPHQVRITTISKQYGSILVGSTINITPLSNTFPIDGSADFLVNVYGLNAGAANDMMNGTLIMNGITGDDGGATFTMLSSIGYNVNIKNDSLGINHNVKVYPIENDYNILIDMTGTPDTTMQDMNQTQLIYTAPNTSYGTFGLVYKDTAGLTSNVNFTVWCIGNDTLMYATDLTAMGTNTVYANYTIKAVRGEQYIWKYNATRVI